MGSQARNLAYLASGLICSAGVLTFGTLLVTMYRAGSVGFWFVVIPLLAVLWAVTLLPLGPEIRDWVQSASGSRVVTAMSAAAWILFLGFCAFAVFLSGGKVGLFIIVAYAIVSGVLLLLMSLPNAWTGVAYRARMPVLLAATFTMVCVGLLFLIGAAP